MSNYQLDPHLIHKIKNERLLMLSTEPNRNEVYEFEGSSIKLLDDLIREGTFTLEKVRSLGQKYSANEEDIKSLWDFCVGEKIFILES